jgi:hypothetical protein
MFDRPADAVDGILNDWDMAAILTEERQVPLSTARHCTGTVPFMAIDLLRPDPPAHLYRHDLESFFYILVWAAINYDLSSGERTVHNELKKWDDTLDQSRVHKKDFLTDAYDFDRVVSHVREEFQDLLLQWIKPLWSLFAGARASAYSGPDPATYDYATYDRRVTFHTFMAALGVKPRNPPTTTDERSI